MRRKLAKYNKISPFYQCNRLPHRKETIFTMSLQCQFCENILLAQQRTMSSDPIHLVEMSSQTLLMTWMTSSTYH